MNYTEVLQALNEASLFDLYRLNSAIYNQLEDPARLAAVKRALAPGQKIRYFDGPRNCLVQARVEAIHRTRVSVVDVEDGQPWKIPF